MAMKRNIYNNEYKSQKRNIPYSPPDMTEESPNWSFKSFRGSKGFNDKLKDAWWEGDNGFGWTHFGWHLRLRLDHILYSDEL